MAYATLLSLTQTIDQILHPDDRLMVLHETEQQIMRSLQEKVGFLLSFLENDSLKHTESKLEPRIRDVAYKVEVIIGSGFPHQNYESSQRVVEELDSVLEQVVKMKEMNKVEDLLPPTMSLPTGSRESGSSDKTEIVALHKEMMDIKDRLIRSPSTREIISIVGMPGIGKTTLAKTLYDDLLTVKRFDVRAWITVSHNYHLQQMLIGILDSIQDMNHDSYPEDLASHLYKTLKKRRYLIVMDDMWDINAWDQVKRYFPNDNNGSRVVLTTRLQDVAIRVECPDSIYHLNLLGPDDSWKLLCQKAFKEEHCPREFEALGKEIANNCQGLPLSLALIGGVLYKAERKLDVWRYIGENVNSILNNTNEQVMDILSLSYKHLPHYLRACFLYMGVFPRGREISKSKLIKLWIAEGFIKPAPFKCLEEVARECLENLIDRNMILVLEYDHVGGIKKCGIHDLIWELCMRIVEDEKFLKVVYSQLEIPLDYGYNFRHLYIRSTDCLAGIYGLPPNSLVSSQTESQNTDLSPCVLSSHRLRVLDAQKSPFPEFQDENVELVGLRYISIHDWEGDCSLPSSIPKLSNLQTLVITSQNAVILPFEIWLMPQLQHIKTRKCFLPYPESGKKVFPLKNLQTLKGVTNFRFTKDAIRMMPNLKKLGIKFYLYGSDIDLSSYCIGLVLLHQLESVNVSIEDESDTKYPLPENLSLPPTLKKLTLSGFKLSQGHMTIIGLLQDLEELNLKRISFDDSRWEAIGGQFLGLKSLYMHDTDLEYLKADETSFPILESLRFSFCTNLIEIPPEIGGIPTLKLIRLVGCSTSADDSVLLIQKEQEDLGNYNLQIALYSVSREMFRIGFLLQNLRELLLYNVELISSIKDEVKLLLTDLTLFESFLKEYSAKRIKKEILKAYVNEIRDVVYEAEDILETFVTHAAEQKAWTSSKKIFHLTDYTSEFRRVGKQIETIRSKVKNFYDKVEFGFDALQTHLEGSNRPPREKMNPTEDEDNIVGFQDEAQNVINLLIGGSEDLEVISVVGMPGLGKTTLAKMIFRHPAIELEFYNRAWVYVSYEYNRKEVFLNILRQFTRPNYDVYNMNDIELAYEIRHVLGQGKYFIVLDDVWTKEAWDHIKIAFPNNKNRSRILLSSRESVVARHANPNIDPYQLRFLKDDESWELLQRKSLSSKECPEELRSYGLNIVKECKGLPLALVVIGRVLLENGNERDWWQKVSQNVDAYIKEDMGKTMESFIEMSFNHLPYHLKACFLYFGMFAEDYQISVWKLVRLWIAEDFIQENDEIYMEDRADGYLDELMSRNLVMVGERRPNGKIETCYVHDMLHVFCKNQAAKENFFHEIKQFDPSSHPNLTNYHRLCIHSRILSYILSKPAGPHVRSFLCFTSDETEVPPEKISYLPGAFKLIRVFGGKPIHFSQFPRNLSELIHLTYINLSGQFRIPPQEILKLWNLQTLTVETSSHALEIIEINEDVDDWEADASDN